MTTVTKQDIISALKALGIKSGDSVMVHSSFKSFGYVDGGAETVIGAFLSVLTEEGTLVMPAFTQEHFSNAYETWHMDKKSDVGYLTEYFRKREDTLRSDQATHSVCACGKLAKYFTETHGHIHKRDGIYGDTPFSADSPFEKMYNMNTKIVLIGVTEPYITFKHYTEYRYIEEALQSIEHLPEHDEMKNQLAAVFREGTGNIWPSLNPIWASNRLREKGIVTDEKCGDAHIMCIPSNNLVNFMLHCLRTGEQAVLIDPVIKSGAFTAWDNTVKALSKK